MATRRFSNTNSNIHAVIPIHSMDRSKDHEEQTAIQAHLAISALQFSDGSAECVYRC